MKFRRCRKLTGLILSAALVLCAAGLAGCGGSSAADRSDRTFAVSHFSGETPALRTMTATNGRDVFYVSGGNIYQYPGSQPVVSDVDDIRMLTASEQRLYILLEDETAIVYDTEAKQTARHGRGILSIEAVGNSIFWSTAQGLFCCDEAAPEQTVSLSDVICSGTPMGEIDGYFDIFCSTVDGIRVYSEGVSEREGGLEAVSLLTVENRSQPRSLDDYRNRRVPLYYHDGWIYGVNCGHIHAYGENGMISEHTEAKTGKYRGAIENQFIKGGVVYELLQAPDYHGSEWGSSPYDYNFPQKYLLHDCVYATDLNTRQNFVVYRTEDNLTRVVGFDGAYVYLFDVQNYTLCRYDPAAEEKTKLGKLPEYDDLAFEWCGSLLFVYSGGSAVEIIEA